MKNNFSPLAADKYVKSTKQSTHWCHQANEGKSCLEVEKVQVLAAMRSLQSEKKLLAEKWHEMQFLSNEEMEK